MAVFRIPVTQFVSASKAYLNAQVKKANTNGNAYLTKAEIDTLPKDLKGNVETHRLLAQGNGRVTISKLKTAWGGYVAVNAKKADVNGDGKLTLTEGTREMVSDLRDNFRNYYNAIKPRS